MRWRLRDPITKAELRRLLARERHIRAGIEEQLNDARARYDQLETLYAVTRAKLKKVQ